MENVSVSMATPPDWDDDALLLREALAFIGDLDDGGLSPLGEDLDALVAVPSATTIEPVGDVEHVSGAILPPLAAEPPAITETVAAPQPAVAPSRGETKETQDAPALAWPSSAPKQPKPVGNRARNKRREELLYLREMVGELEQQLTGLKRQADDEQLEKIEQTAEQDRPSALVLAAWEQVATRQYEQRQASEMVNAKLKRLLEEQIQVGKSLERLLLRKRPKLEPPEPGSLFEKRPRHGSLSTSWDDKQIFHELHGSIDSLYADTPRVLAKAQSLVSGKLSHRNVELVRDEELGMVLRTTEARLLPFGYELAVEEFWASMSTSLNDKITGFHDFDISDDLLKTQFQATANFGRMSGDITAFMVERRFRETDRTVFVSSAFFDPGQISGTSMDGVYMRHKGWIVFEPVAASGLTKAATRMTSYLVTVPEVFEGLEDSTHKVGTLTNFLMTGLSLELESRQQIFENRLFDRSVHS